MLRAASTVAAACAAAASAGCFDPDLPTRLACAPPDDECPGDQTCVEGRCYPSGDDGSGGDGADGGGKRPGDGLDAGGDQPDAASQLGAWEERSGPSGDSALSLSFSVTTGWMVSDRDRLWRSATAGDTWTEHELPVSPRAVDAASDNSAWLLANLSDDRIWRSAEGVEFSPTEALPNGTFRNVAAASSLRAAVGSDTGTEVSTTEDGGASWETHDVPGIPGVRDLAVSGDLLVAVGGTSTSGATVALSPDFGQTWFFPEVSDDAHDELGGPLNAVVATGHGSLWGGIWTAGANRQLYHSDDGSTFAQIDGIPDGFGDFEAVAAAGSHVIAAGRFDDGTGAGVGIYESLDGGDTWQIGHRDRCGCDVRGAAVHPDGTLWVFATGGHFLSRRL